MNNYKAYFDDDLEEIYLQSKEFAKKFGRSSVLVAGATGFVGSWIISSIEHMNRHHHSNIDVTAISRSIRPELISAFPNTRFVSLDLSKRFNWKASRFDCIFNAATPSSPLHGGENPVQVFEAASEGTRNLIELCSKSNSPTFINLSSGIVTKRKGEDLHDMTDVKNAYLAGKRKSEESVINATADGLISGKNLRLYAFAGPGISLVDHFAVGNFINDALLGNPIKIKGNPETRRSYLYPTDLAINIFAAAVSQSIQSMELGSLHEVSMKELAHLINTITGNWGINQMLDYVEGNNYFPEINNLAVNQIVTLETGLIRWVRWIKGN